LRKAKGGAIAEGKAGAEDIGMGGVVECTRKDYMIKATYKQGEGEKKMKRKPSKKKKGQGYFGERRFVSR